MGYAIWQRPWPGKTRRWSFWLLGLELLGIIPVLVIFGISQPDLYRTKMWEVGWDNKFNSNPKQILYAYANHRPLPKIPFVWSYELTSFNVAISVVSLFLMLAKLIGLIMKIYKPIMGVCFAFAMTALYATSIYGQVGPDYSDPRYPSPVAWYIAKDCSYAKPKGYYSLCMIAKGSLAITVYMLFIYLVAFGLAVKAMLPNKQLDHPIDDEDDEGPVKTHVTSHNVELQPQTPRMAMPFTPRTQAFQTLDRKLPLRTNYA